MRKSTLVIIVITILTTASACAKPPKHPEVNQGISTIDSVQPAKSTYKPQASLPDKYPSDLAEENGDVVFVSGKAANQDKLLKFIEAYQNKKAAQGDIVRITNYTTEGDAIITDLVIDSTEMKLIEDATRDKFSNSEGRKRTEYRVREIVKTEKPEGTTYTAKIDKGEERYLTFTPSSK
jgi:hypothetical protein